MSSKILIDTYPFSISYLNHLAYGFIRLSNSQKSLHHIMYIG